MHGIDRTDFVLEARCPSTEWQAVPAAPVLALLAEIRAAAARPPVATRSRALVRAADRAEAALAVTTAVYAVDSPCGWVGAVDATRESGVIRWTCPRCGTENEEEYERDSNSE